MMNLLNFRVRSNITGNMGTIIKIEEGNFKCYKHDDYHCKYFIHIKWDIHSQHTAQCSCDLDNVEVGLGLE